MREVPGLGRLTALPTVISTQGRAALRIFMRKGPRRFLAIRLSSFWLCSGVTASAFWGSFYQKTGGGFDLAFFKGGAIGKRPCRARRWLAAKQRTYSFHGSRSG